MKKELFLLFVAVLFLSSCAGTGPIPVRAPDDSYPVQYKKDFAYCINKVSNERVKEGKRPLKLVSPYTNNEVSKEIRGTAGRMIAGTLYSTFFQMGNGALAIAGTAGNLLGAKMKGDRISEEAEIRAKVKGCMNKRINRYYGIRGR